jgi:hypothetical protein
LNRTGLLAAAGHQGIALLLGLLTKLKSIAVEALGFTLAIPL